ncbi:hypothetical protein MTR_5g086360 [Medicago truncatula]|uniref:Uncharacterized protein n=1 Tax=Medicago truncatula TaxID=3880 RepID=G7KCM6_MEDTR|nr:hypothetical protein MTR_5g086360 [Medicago truncatula]
MVQRLGSPSLELLQLVIPPLSRARGLRCSAKPASRSALSSRNQETKAFAQIPWPNSQLGEGKPTYCRNQPSPTSHSHVPIL